MGFFKHRPSPLILLIQEDFMLTQSGEKPINTFLKKRETTGMKVQ